MEIWLHLFLTQALGRSWIIKLAHQSNYSGVKSRSLSMLWSLPGPCIEKMKACSFCRLNLGPSRQIPWEFSCNGVRLRHSFTLLWYNRWHPVFIRYTNSLWQRILMQYLSPTEELTITWGYKPRTVHKMGLASSTKVV